MVSYFLVFGLGLIGGFAMGINLIYLVICTQQVAEAEEEEK